MNVIARICRRLVVCFVVIVGRSCGFKTLKFEVFKDRTREIIVLISIITLCADSVATYASLDQF